ncbi:hypothetical protein [Silvimonas sp.]|uniref:hypothetical protein n=1 Tax=Silvimonas sp. TaxID=2650811 RepID=UPI0028517E07|nr:hypothetical protein [Silvimonas sp.]MDR3428990.1 hypothetical protein [Silvimonas sp.]
MTDQFDRASDIEQAQRSAAIAAARKPVPRATPAPSGNCPWCDDPAPVGSTFCGAECAKDWQDNYAPRQRAAQITGQQIRN